MKNNKNMNKNIYVVLPILSILVVLGMGIFLIQPKIATIQEKQASIAQEENRKVLLTSKIAKLEELNQNKTDLIAKLTSINVALPTQKDVPTLVIQIQKTAQDSDVEIQSIQSSPGKLVDEQGAPTKTGPEIAINMSIKGNYEAIETFLGKVFHGKRLINLESINLTSSGASESDSGLTATLIMNTFYQPLPPKPADETEEVPQLTASENATYDKIQSYESLQAEGNAINTPKPQATPDVEIESASPSPTAKP